MPQLQKNLSRNNATNEKWTSDMRAETMKNSEGQICQFSTPEDWKPVQSETKSACSNCTNKKKKNGEICVCHCTLGTPEITC